MMLFVTAVTYFVVVIITAHFFMPEAYHWTQHTISELAAQGLPHQWVMQTGFIGFGLLINLAFIQKFRRQKRIIGQDLLIMLYGTAVLLSGIYSTAPFLDGVVYSQSEADLHSLFAQIAGFSFSIAIFIYAVRGGSNGRYGHSLFFLLVIGFSAGFGLSENGSIPIGRGLMQRLLYLVSFIWLLSSQYQSTTETKND
jgi:hypothetical membrane protein